MYHLPVSYSSVLCTKASNPKRLGKKKKRQQTIGLTRFHGCSVRQIRKNAADLLCVAAPALIFIFSSPLFPPHTQEGRKDKRGKGVSRRPFPLQKISSPNSSTSPTLTSIKSPPRSEQEPSFSHILVSHVSVYVGIG